MVADSAMIEIGEGVDFESLFAEVCVELSGVEELGSSFTARLEIQNGTATQGEDFEGGIRIPSGCPFSALNDPPFAPISQQDFESRMILREREMDGVFVDFFMGTELTACGVVSILPDLIFEGPENLTLTLVDGDFSVGEDNITSMIVIVDPEGTYLEMYGNVQYNFRICILDFKCFSDDYQVLIICTSSLKSAFTVIETTVCPHNNRLSHYVHLGRISKIIKNTSLPQPFFNCIVHHQYNIICLVKKLIVS